jgi:RNA polymerase sigma-54 factor
MNSLELLDYIEDQLVSNPALEKVLDLEANEITEYRADCQGDEQDPTSMEMPGSPFTLKEHLQNQLYGINLDKSGCLIGEYLIDSTDDNGYVTADTSEVAAVLNVPESMVMSVLHKLQALDPPGICARNLQECLLIQIEQLDEADEAARLVVKNYLDYLASDDAEAVALAAGLPIDRIRNVFGIVKSLEPRPGRDFYRNEVEKPKIPDIIIRETSEGGGVIYNEEIIPEICISESFTHNDGASEEGEAEDYIHEKVKSAVWFIKCLEQRKNILTSLWQKIYELERSFFENGPKNIILIDKARVAAVLDMHESILDKALEEKYLQCRWGIFELKAFFKGKGAENEGEYDQITFF